jgi:hypothetical protein
MLLLLSSRYPVLSAVLSVLASLAGIAYGVATSHSVMIVMGALGVALCAARFAQRSRRHSSQARS